MKNSTFLSTLQQRNVSVTSAATVGSPSAHRRGIMLKLISVLVLILTIGVGNVWGTTFSKTDFSGNGTITASKDGITISCVGNIPSKNNYVTFTENNTLTISSTAGNITAIDFTCSSDDYTGNLSDVSNISTPSWSIKVDNPGNKTTVRVTSIEVTVEVATPHKVKLMDKNVTLEEESAGAGVTLPSREGCTGFTFAGWTASWTEEQDEWTTTAPTIIPAGSYTPTADENLYPVYTKTEEGGVAFSQYSKVNHGGTITEGKYLISTGSYTMAGSGKTGASFTPGQTEAITKEYTIHLLGNGVFTILGPDNKYVGGKDANDGLLFDASEPTANSYKWKYTSNGIQNQQYTSRYLKAYSTTDFRHYASGSGVLTYLYKRVEEASSTTYYISEPNCCQPLAQIKGSLKVVN